MMKSKFVFFLVLFVLITKRYVYTLNNKLVWIYNLTNVIKLRKYESENCHIIQEQTYFNHKEQKEQKEQTEQKERILSENDDDEFIERNIKEQSTYSNYINEGVEENFGDSEHSEDSEDLEDSESNLLDDIVGEEIDKMPDISKDSPKTSSMLQYASGEDEISKEITISNDSLNFIKSVCDDLIGGNLIYQNMCESSELFYALKKLKEKQNAIYLKIINGEYEGHKEHYTLELLKDEQGKSFLKEEDNHDPKYSALFIFSKFCYGGIPMACANLSKIGDTKGEEEAAHPKPTKFVQEKEAEPAQEKEAEPAQEKEAEPLQEMEKIIPYETEEEIEPYKQFIPEEPNDPFENEPLPDEVSEGPMKFTETVEEI